MTQQIINVGAAPNDGTGDLARTAFTKSNDNFTELYTNFPAGAWTAWSPTISSSVGTITSSTVNVARYTKAGKTITAYFDFTINDQGSGSAFLQISLPVAVSASGGGFAAAQEIDVTGMLFMGALTASNTLVQLVAYNGVGIVATGHRLLGMIIYESV